MTIPRFASLLLAVLGPCAMALADPPVADRPDFEAATGRSRLNYPPHRVVDFLHMKLEVVIPDMQTPSLSARQTLTLRPIAAEVGTLTLDAGPATSMMIRAVGRADGGEASFEQAGESLRLNFSPPLPTDRETTLAIEYELKSPPAGIIWTPESADWPGRPAQLHTQGESDFSHYWFPCHDFPNERLTTELVATVPAGFTVSSNGRLVSHQEFEGSETFHWSLTGDHANYLVSMVVGKFDVVNMASGRVPLTVYAPLGRGGDVQRTFGRTGRMIETFERVFDEPYPWDRYAQVAVHNFGWGGMENSSCTTLFDGVMLDEQTARETDQDELISHELAHQWFGDLLTCKSWEHIWLNEGFATYCEAIWADARDGDGKGTGDAYGAALWGYYQQLVGPSADASAGDRGVAPTAPAMASKIYGHADDVFERTDDAYAKGAWVLHMLRREVGDEVFFRSLRDYVDGNKHGCVETDDLRYALERNSGRSLQRFFDQWCTRPGLPRISVKTEYSAATGELRIRLRQEQTIDGANPAYMVTVPMHVATGPNDGDSMSPLVLFDGREAEITLSTPRPPRFVAVDPQLSTLAGYDVDQPEAAWADQLEHGPTFFARMQAARALGKPAAHASAEVGEALARVARSGRAHWMLRSECLRSLARGGTVAPLLAMVQAPELRSAPRIRAALAEALGIRPAGGDTDSSGCGAALASLWANDPSVLVRAECVKSLGALNAAGAMAAIDQALATDSWNDTLRSAALSALASLGTPEALDRAQYWTRAGVYSRTRAEAARTVASLAEVDRSRAIAALTALLADPELRVFESAGEGLARIGDPSTTPVIEDLAKNSLSGYTRDRAELWLAAMRSKKQAP